MDLGLVEGSGEGFVGEDVGEVDERAGRRGDADAVVRGGVGVGGAVDVDGGVATVAGCGDVRRRWPPGDDPPQRCGRSVAQGGVGTAGEHGRHRRGER